MKSQVEKNRSNNRIIIYSGHDVSVLALLHAIGAKEVQAEAFWPGYSSAVTLELFEDVSASSGTDRWFVRTSMDDQPLFLTSDAKEFVPFHEFELQLRTSLGYK